MDAAQTDLAVAALASLVKNTPGGRHAVAAAIGANEQTLYQILAGIPLRSGRPRTVGRDLREKLDKAFPGWFDETESMEAAHEQQAERALTEAGLSFRRLQPSDRQELPEWLKTIEGWRYLPDYQVRKPDGSLAYVEVKHPRYASSAGQLAQLQAHRPDEFLLLLCYPHDFGRRIADWVLGNYTDSGALAHAMSPQADTLPTLSWERLMSTAPEMLPAAFWVSLGDDALAPKLPKGSVVRFTCGLKPEWGQVVLLRDAKGNMHARVHTQALEHDWRAVATSAAYTEFNSDSAGVTRVAAMTALEVRGPLFL